MMDAAFAAPLITVPALIGASVGAFASADIIHDEDVRPAPKPAKIARGVIVGALWGASAGYYSTRAIPQSALEATLLQLRWPAALTLGAILGFGLLALLARRGGPARALARIVGATIAATIVFATLFVLPNLSLGPENADPHTLDAEEKRAMIRYLSTGGGAALFFLLVGKLAAREFATAMLAITAAFGVGAAAASYFMDGGMTDSVWQFAIGGAATASIFSFLGLLLGAALAAAIGIAFSIVATLFPAVEAAADWKDPMSEHDDISPPNPGHRVARALGAFARLVQEGGPLQVIAVFCGIFGFVGAIVGLIPALYLSEHIWLTLANPLD